MLAPFLFSVFCLILLLPQVFKICLEYWNFFVPDVYSSVCTVEPASTAVAPAVRTTLPAAARSLPPIGCVCLPCMRYKRCCLRPWRRSVILRTLPQLAH